MKKYYLPLMMIMPLMSNAQIIITGADLPAAGNIYINANDTTYNAAITAGGASQVWNFGSLQNNTQDTTAFIAAAGTPSAAQFPNSNLATYNANTNTYAYFIADNSGFKINGGAINGGPVLIYNPPLTFV